MPLSTTAVHAWINMNGILLCLLLLPVLLHGASPGANETLDESEISITVPDMPTTEEDTYLCAAIHLPAEPHKLVGMRPNADMETVSMSAV